MSMELSPAWDDRWRFVQNKAPKVTASDMSPAEWPSNPDHEWCPPGHGDLYPAMLGTAGVPVLMGEFAVKGP